MDTGPRIGSYDWRGGREAMLRFGRDEGPLVILALPLFEEANRTRAFGVAILRALAMHDIGGTLPEVPGQGESVLPTVQASLIDLQSALKAVPGSHIVAIRSGALLADARPCWALSPQDGPSLLRELARVRGAAIDGSETEVAGNRLNRSWRDALALATPPRLGRIVRLASDAGAADRHVVGPPPWRRAEPDTDADLTRALAADIAAWIAACEG